MVTKTRDGRTKKLNLALVEAHDSYDGMLTTDLCLGSSTRSMARDGKYVRFAYWAAAEPPRPADAFEMIEDAVIPFDPTQPALGEFAAMRAALRWLKTTSYQRPIFYVSTVMAWDLLTETLPTPAVLYSILAEIHELLAVTHAIVSRQQGEQRSVLQVEAKEGATA